MYCSGFSRRLARHRLALPISLLLGTAISSMSLAAEVDINDGDNYLSAGDVVDILGLGNVGIIENHAGFTIGSAPANAVEVTGDLGIFINGGTILGADRGVLVGGIVTSFTNAAGGIIESTVDTAVHLQGTVGDFTNAGVIKGEWLGVNIDGSVANFTNAAGGSIESVTGDAVNFHDGVGRFTNAGSILGAQWGVYIEGDAATFINAAGGSIEGTAGIGVDLIGSTGDFINAGRILGATHGVYVDSEATSFTNAAGATIEGAGEDGLTILGKVGSLTNAGAISGANWGVYLGGDVNSFINAAGGRIEGAADIGVEFIGDVGTFTNAGSINGNGDGVRIAGSVATFTNAATGSIKSAQWSGVYVDGDVTSFTNASGGRIESAQGYRVSLNGTVGTFANGGAISGNDDGVRIAGNIISFTNAATGSIASAQWSGVYLDGTAGDIINAGAIVGQGLGVNVSGAVTRFINTAGARIEGQTGTGVRLGSEVATFGNAGHIIAEGDSVYIVGRTTTFGNTASGLIESRTGTAVTFENGVDTFGNTGRIESGGPFGVASFSDVGDFGNAGRIAGQSAGVYIDGAVSSFTNAASGEIVGADNAVHIIGHTASFSNDGALRSTDGPPTVLIDGSVGSFRNRGTITGGGWGVSLNSVDDFFNSGTISAVGPGPRIGVFIAPSVGGGPASSFVNTGTIEGTETGVRFEAGVTNMINSGVVRGGFTAFDSSGVYDDRLTLLTGSQIYGALSFGGGFDTLDFAGFIGNTVLDVGGLERLVPGSISYVDARNGGAAGKIAILDISGLDNKAIGRELGDVTGAVRNMVADQLAGAEARGPAPVAPLGYAANTPATAATAALNTFEAAPAADVGFWAGAVGGGSGRKEPLDLASRFGGIVTGSHAQLGDALILGGLAGYFNSTSSILNEQEKLETQTGLIGLYGKTALGVIDFDFTLLGGGSAHKSHRQIVANGAIETAEGTFNSVFIAPSIGASIPVLSADTTTLLFRGEASYVAGLTSGYTETGSSMNLAVGEQVIGLLDVRLGLEARHILDVEGHKTELVAKAGALAQANLGTSSIPVTTLGQTVDVGSPGSQSLGLYGGLGVDMAVTESFGVNLRLDGQLRFDDRSSLSASIGFGGTF